MIRERRLKDPATKNRESQNRRMRIRDCFNAGMTSVQIMKRFGYSAAAQEHRDMWPVTPEQAVELWPRSRRGGVWRSVRYHTKAAAP
jgi:hypothetical protein